MSIRL